MRTVERRRTLPWTYRRAGVIVLVVALFGLTAGTTAEAGAVTRRPSGPAATLTTLTGGNGVYLGEGTKPDLARLGYKQREYAAAGTATSYGRRRADPRRALDVRAGRRRLPHAGPRARPAKAADFSGTVIVEWLNVSGGVDADPEWTTPAGGDRAQRRRVGRRLGAEHRCRGWPGRGEGRTCPGRITRARASRRSIPRATASLAHPGDAYSFDIFTQVARALRDGSRRSAARSRNG